jgi:hypothetical protein
MSSSGAGYYYFSFYFGETIPFSSYIVAFNTASNMAYSFTVNSDGTSDSQCRLLGGRVISAGNSELHFAAYASGSWTMRKLSFNGQHFQDSPILRYLTRQTMSALQQPTFHLDGSTLPRQLVTIT